MKVSSYKRILAYIIDIFIVAFISSIITMVIPSSENYQNLSNDLTKVVEDYTNGDIEKDDYLNKVNDISYSLNKESIPETIVSIVISVVYFVVGAYYCNGQTLGKKAMKLQVVSVKKTKKLSLNNYLIRSLIIDSILLNIISVILILICNKNLYLSIYNVLSYIFSIAYIISFIMILFRSDARGLHDLLANTKVINLPKETTLEAEVINESRG